MYTTRISSDDLDFVYSRHVVVVTLRLVIVLSSQLRGSEATKNKNTVTQQNPGSSQCRCRFRSTSVTGACLTQQQCVFKLGHIAGGPSRQV